MLEKISGIAVQERIKLAAETIRDLDRELQSERAKVALLTRNEHLRKVAGRMEDLGVDPHVSFDEKVASLRGQGDDDIVIFEKALEMHSTKTAGLTVEDTQKVASAEEQFNLDLGASDVVMPEV